jgi:hypothetical protein
MAMNTAGRKGRSRAAPARLPFLSHARSFGGTMDHNVSPDIGLRRLIRQCRNEFRSPENLNHYTEEDFREAERKYIRFCLTGNPVNPAEFGADWFMGNRN